MAKSIKLKDNTYWNTKSIVHNKTTLDTILDLRGSTAVFYKNDNQTLSKQTASILKFNRTSYVDNGCFSLNNDGTIKVLKDISRVLVTTNCRINGLGIIYINGSNGGFNGDIMGNSSFALQEYMYNTAGVIEVSKNSTISIKFYPTSNETVAQGYDRNWFSVTLTVLK